MEFQAIKNFLKSLPGVNKDMFDLVWAKHSHDFALDGVTLASVQNATKTYDENSIDYISSAGVYNFKILTASERDLTPEKLNWMKLMNDMEKEKTMNR